MKISFDVECTPEELRVFLGLPDVQPMQRALMGQIEERMAASLAVADPETMLKAWMPAGVQGIEQLQKLFWSQFAAAGGRRKESKA